MGKSACWLPSAEEVDCVHSGSHLPIVVYSVNLTLQLWCHHNSRGMTRDPLVTAACVSQGSVRTGKMHFEKGQHFGHRAST